MMLAGALVACSAFFKVPEPEPMPGPVIVVPSAEPTPEVTPGPTPEPTASPTVEPEPSPSPTAIPYIPPKPPAPTPTTVPVPPPTPRPADPTPTPTTVPPETPTPGPTEEPVEDDVFVEIIGNQATYAYTGEEQFVRGYTYTVYVNGEEADSSLFTVTYHATDDMTYPYAAGIEPGTYEMGLTEDSFTVSSGTYDLFGVAVEDGWLQINESGSSETHTAPDVTALGASNFFGTSADPISYVDGRITLKEDLNKPGASGTAGLYRVDGTDVYTLVSNEISYTYGTSTSTDGTIPLEFEYHHPASGANFNQDQFIIRFNYTFPDGTTGTKDTSVFHLYNPGFLGTPTYTWDGDKLTISAEIIFRNLMPNYSQKIHPHQYESGNWLLLTREDGTLVNVTPTFSVESVDYGAKDLVTVTYDLSGEAADETYDFEGVFDYLMYEDEPNFPWQAKVKLTDIHQ